MVTAAHLRAPAKARVNDSNLNSVMMALDRFGAGAGFGLPHCAVQFLAQLLHESGLLRHDHELWGPTHRSATTSARISPTRRKRTATAARAGGVAPFR